MTREQLVEKLRMFARTGRERRNNVVINGYHADTFDEAADYLESLSSPSDETLRGALEEARAFVVIHGPVAAFPDLLAKIDAALRTAAPQVNEAMERLVLAARDVRDRFPPRLGCSEDEQFPVEAKRIRALEAALKPFAALPAAPQDYCGIEQVNEEEG